MKNIELEVKKQSPMRLTLRGNHFNQTQQLSLKELSSFIERDLLELQKSLCELQLETSLSVNEETRLVEVWVRTPSFYAFESTISEIEEVLWQYNCQTLIQKNGRFYTNFSRFDYKLCPEFEPCPIQRAG